MNILCTLMILSVIWADYLFNLGVLPKFARFLPEMLSAACACIVVARGVQQKFRNISLVYMLLFGMLVMSILFGIFANSVDAGPIVAGARSYLKAVIFFFLPAVVAFSFKQFTWQTSVILASSILQSPIALWQRLAGWDAGRVTGDIIVGSLLISSRLSFFQIAVVAVLFALFLAQRIRFTWVLVLVPILLLPTLINETKSSLLFIPAAFIIPAYLVSKKTGQFRSLLISLVISISAIGAFIPVYDHYYAVPKWGYGIVDFITMEGRVESYLSKDATAGSDVVGRVDSIRIPLEELSHDPVSLSFGLGIGNVSGSQLGPQFEGAYYRKYGDTRLTALGVLIWEFGLIGVLLILLIHLRVYVDISRVFRSTSPYSDYAPGIMTIVIIAAVSLVYKDFTPSNAIGYLYWYICGYMVAESVRQRTAENVQVQTQLQDRVMLGNPQTE